MISCRVCSTACTVIDGFFPYVVQMITRMRGCVAHNDFDRGLCLQHHLDMILKGIQNELALWVIMGQ